MVHVRQHTEGDERIEATSWANAGVTDRILDVSEDDAVGFEPCGRELGLALRNALRILLDPPQIAIVGTEQRDRVAVAHAHLDHRFSLGFGEGIEHDVESEVVRGVISHNCIQTWQRCCATQ